MDRRLFLQGMAAMSAALPFGTWADEVKDAFQAQSAQPWTLGFRSMDSDRLHTASLPMDGAMPQALSGVFYRNGPARHERGGMRYHHWFDGDGMVRTASIPIRWRQ